MRKLAWVGSSLDDLKKFSKKAKSRAGYELRRVQAGENPTDWKPMPSIGAGAREIRIHSGNEYRVIYVASLKETVYVLHCFIKKTRKTSRQDIVIARTRLKETQ